MGDRNWERWGVASGVLIVVVFVVAILATGSPPKPTASNEVVKTFLVDKRGALLLQGWLFGVGAALLVWWAAAIRSMLRRGEDAGGPMANTFYGATLATAALLLLVGAVQNGVVYKAAPNLDPAVARAVFDILAMTGLLFSLFLAVGALAFAAIALPSGLFPKWVGYLAAVNGVVNVVGTLALFSKTGAFSAEGAFGFVVFGLNQVWLLAVSITALRQDATA